MPDKANDWDYLVIGAGAIGGTLAAHLARAGFAVAIVDSAADHVAAIRERGLMLRRGRDESSIAIAAYLPSEAHIPSARRVLMSVKGVGATERASDWIRQRLEPEGFVVCLQNGLQFERVAERIGVRRTVGAFVDFFADVVAPGVILDGGSGALRIGEIDGRSSRRVNDLVGDLQTWGPAAATTNIVGFLWAKLGFSAMLAATALADADMAELIDRHWELMSDLAREVFTVASAIHVRLEPFDAFDPIGLRGSRSHQRRAIEHLSEWLKRQSKTRSGVWRDIAVHHRRTEATGRYTDLIATAAKLGIRCPHLESLVGLLGECERGERAMSEDNLALLCNHAKFAIAHS